MSSVSRIFIGRQPILDREQRVVAYELLFRASFDANRAEFEEQSSAATRVMVSTFMNLGPDAVLGDCLGFFNVTESILKSDVLLALPAQRVVIEILENVVGNDEVLRSCRDLRKRGFQLALDDYVLNDPRHEMLGFVDLVKVDLMAVEQRYWKRLVRKLRRHPVKILAEKVETRQQFETCLELGFDLFQGYFFARPSIVEGTSLDPARLVLMEILQQIQREVDVAEITDTLKRHVELGVNLIRLVNSAAMAKPCAIAGVEDAVNFLGRRHLQRWITILLFAGADPNGVKSPLLQAAAHRARLMELVAERTLDGGDGGSQGERAFLVGMLSFIDVLLQRPKEEILDQLSLHPEISDALLKGEGELGALLSLAQLSESCDVDRLDARLSDFALDLAQIQQADNEAYRWVHGLSRQGLASG